MNKQVPEVIFIEALTDYTDKDASELGELFPHLSSRFDGSPVSRELLTEIIESPSHEQLVARDENDNIVGAATLTIVIGAANGRIAFLEDFVVNPEIRGFGIGKKIWQAMIDWCKNNNLGKLEFTSKITKSAHEFYIKQGAEVRESRAYRIVID